MCCRLLEAILRSSVATYRPICDRPISAVLTRRDGGVLIFTRDSICYSIWSTFWSNAPAKKAALPALVAKQIWTAQCSP